MLLPLDDICEPVMLYCIILLSYSIFALCFAGKIGAVEGYYTEEMLQRLKEKFEQEFSVTGLTFQSFP